MRIDFKRPLRAGVQIELFKYPRISSAHAAGK